MFSSVKKKKKIPISYLLLNSKFIIKFIIIKDKVIPSMDLKKKRAEGF